ncbi:MAG: hypothetical protein ABIQ60_12250, partial [Burkholderiaceae bacterium]
TDSAAQLPQPTDLPVLDLNDADAVADFLVHSGARFEYAAPLGSAAVLGDEGPRHAEPVVVGRRRVVSD